VESEFWSKSKTQDKDQVLCFFFIDNPNVYQRINVSMPKSTKFNQKYIPGPLDTRPLSWQPPARSRQQEKSQVIDKRKGGEKERQTRKKTADGSKIYTFEHNRKEPTSSSPLPPSSPPATRALTAAKTLSQHAICGWVVRKTIKLCLVRPAELAIVYHAIERYLARKFLVKVGRI